MRLLVTGKTGQLALSLIEAGKQRGYDVVAIGRPELDLTEQQSVEDALQRVCPTVVINAAAYTGVDRAEHEPALAHAVNAVGAGHVAAACERLAVPLIHISTDYVFDGSKGAPYVEGDETCPIGVYGQSKRRGEQSVLNCCKQSVVLRTAWVHSPFGHNFVRTMLRLADTKPDIDVVNDQVGNPTYALHLADTILDVARRVLTAPSPSIWGVYHAVGEGSATWHTLADHIFRYSRALGGPHARVRPISTAEYPTSVRRPADSRLDCSLLNRVFGTALPHWQWGARACVARLVPAEATAAPKIGTSRA